MRCTLCDVLYYDEDKHFSSSSHETYEALNIMDIEDRISLMQNKHGVFVNPRLVDIDKAVKCDKNGAVTCPYEDFVDNNNTVVMKFNIVSKQEDYVMLKNAYTKETSSHFTVLNADIDTIHRLICPGDTKTVEVSFKLKKARSGVFLSTVIFVFEKFTKEGDALTFAIIKEFSVTITERSLENQVIVKTKPLALKDMPGYIKRHIKEEDSCPIPFAYVTALASGLTEGPHMTDADKYLCGSIKRNLGTWYDKNLCEYVPNLKNYYENMRNLLWLDEVELIVQQQRYDLQKVIVNCITKPTFQMKIFVPGLAEKRPSLLAGDTVTLTCCATKHRFSGTISTLQQSHILVTFKSNKTNKRDNKMDPLRNTPINDYAKNPDELFDVMFTHNRISYIRAHESIENASELENYLFPSESYTGRNTLATLSKPVLFNEGIYTNNDQYTAVTNMLYNTAGSAPYVLFGPPGTGKTATLVETILQMVKSNPDKKIFITAPSNSACDNIMEKLLTSKHKFSTDKLIRVYADTFETSDIPEKILPYSNHHVETEKVNGETITKRKDITKIPVVIFTLVHAGKYNKKLSGDVLIVDEAGQARESELCIPLCMLRSGGQLIIAGDPKQLGPVCNSKVAVNYGMNTSFLKRLTTVHSTYKNQNVSFLSMLKKNYRNHEAIIKVPNEKFYDNKLQAMSEFAHKDNVAKICFFTSTFKKGNKMGFPCEFWAVNAKEEQDGRSPSFFNRKEVKTVLNLVTNLVRRHNIKEKDIGVITPYNQQVYKIKNALNIFPEVEIGSVEIFQGREKRIIIISTVRAKYSLLKHDKTYCLGFVQSPERFNVAVTRAIAKLIVVGNPLVLYTDENWSSLMEHCKANNAFYEVSRFDMHDKIGNSNKNQKSNNNQPKSRNKNANKGTANVNKGIINANKDIANGNANKTHEKMHTVTRIENSPGMCGRVMRNMYYRDG